MGLVHIKNELGLHLLVAFKVYLLECAKSEHSYHKIRALLVGRHFCEREVGLGSLQRQAQLLRLLAVLSLLLSRKGPVLYELARERKNLWQNHNGHKQFRLYILYILPHLLLDTTEQPSVSHHQNRCPEVLHVSAGFKAFLEVSCPQEICHPL